MTSFKINTDDLAVRALQESNKTPVISGPVMPVKASKPIQKSPENLPLKSGQVERRTTKSQTNRRQLERRKTDSPVLLDTRSQNERRSKVGRRDDENITSSLKIDEVV